MCTAQICPAKVGDGAEFSTGLGHPGPSQVLECTCPEKALFLISIKVQHGRGTAF